MPKTGFDASGFVKELGRVFGEYRQYNTRSNALLLHQLGAKLQVDLAKAAASLRASQQSKIDAVPLQTNYHVRRRLVRNVGTEAVALKVFRRGKHKGQYKSESIASQIRRNYGRIISAGSKTRQLLGLRHVSVADEIRLRKRFAAYFQASGWLSPRLTAKIGIRPMDPPCVVVEELEGSNLRVTLENPRPNSAEFAEQYLEDAFNYRVNQMYQYIARKIYEEAREFGKPSPNFSGKDLAAEVERAMRGEALAA